MIRKRRNDSNFIKANSPLFRASTAEYLVRGTPSILKTSQGESIMTPGHGQANDYWEKPKQKIPQANEKRKV